MISIIKVYNKSRKEAVMNNNNQFQATIASLESKVDLLEAELIYLNDLLLRCGFPEGTKTLKETAEELLKEGNPSPHEQKPTSFER